MEWVRGKTIGRGSFATVSLATLTNFNSNTDTYTNTKQTSCVVKSSHVLNSSSLENEKQVLEQLGNNHPNVIQLFGDAISKEKGSQFYNLFLEHAIGGSLADQLKKLEGKFECSDVKKYTRGILRGLCHVHENDFVHSDIKLQNVLLFEDGEVKIADFGLARRIGDDSGCQLRGTPLYMSPEIIAGGKGGFEADIWAVGCAVVEMFSGKPAWDCSPESDVSALLYRIGVCGELPNIPENLCDDGKDFLGKCFIKDPNFRWTAQMLLDHPFLSGFDDDQDAPSVSPRCPFEFPDYDSSEFSSLSSGSIESFDSFSFLEESESPCCYPISVELVSSRVPDWYDSDGWVTIR